VVAVGNPRRYAYQPTGMDAWDKKPGQPEAGTHVILSTQGRIGRRAGRFRNVEHADTGEHYGLVLANSLVHVTKKNPGKPDPLEQARAASLINDRRTATP
jgi:hypothetical protein